LLRFSLATC